MAAAAEAEPVMQANLINSSLHCGAQHVMDPSSRLLVLVEHM